MRIMGWLLMAATMTFQPPSPSASARQGPDVRAQPVGTMSDLMVKIIYPASDAVFYIATREPKNEVEWGELQGKTLALAESANLLMMPGRARDQDRWMQDARLMLDAGMAAYRAARRKDVPALEAVNDQLYTSCTSCHQHYRPSYGRRAAPDATAPSAPVAPSASGAPSAQSVSRPASTVVAPPGPPAPSDPLAVPAPRAPSIVGRWKLRAAEDLRADGSVARYPWGPRPVGSIVVEGGACYLQIASSDTPSFYGLFSFARAPRRMPVIA